MIKYFIENEKGEWLSRPGEDPGSCWTRDPYKAWWFDKISNDIGLVGVSKMYNWIIQQEELMADCHITEQEFIELPDESDPGSSFHMSSTFEQQFRDELVFGQSAVKVTPGRQLYLPHTNGKRPDEY